MPPLTNLALQFLSEQTGPDCDLDHWLSYCGELADAIGHWLPKTSEWRILYVEPAKESTLWGLFVEIGNAQHYWSYHMVSVIDGLVHDAWLPELVLPPEEYVAAAFPNQNVTWELM